MSINCTEEQSDNITAQFKAIYSVEDEIKIQRQGIKSSFDTIFGILGLDKKDKAEKKAVKRVYKDWKTYHEDSVDPQSDVVTLFEMIKDK
jgi:hypothetical protein